MESTPERGARLLCPEDVSILALEDELVAGHTCKVIVLDDELEIGALRELIASRLDRAPELSWRLGDLDGSPAWIPVDRVDINDHVVACAVDGPCDANVFRTTVAQVFEQRLDRSRPLWRIDVIPNLAGGGSALVWRIHHALADGMTAMRIGNAVLWDDAPSAGRPGRSGGGGSAVAEHRWRADILTAAREMPQPWLRSPLDGNIGAQRAVGFATTGLSSLRRAAARADGATVNDAVLTVVAGGLRRWLEAHHGHLGSVRVKVPVSLHAAPLDPGHGAGEDQPDAGNRDSFFCVDLPLGSGDPLERLAAIRRATRVRKQGHDAQHIDSLMRQLAGAPRLRGFAERVLTHPRSFALNVSNVPGPRRPVHVLGIRVRALYSLAEIREHHALRVAVVSHGDVLGFGLTADPTLLGDVGLLADGIRDEAVTLIGRVQAV